ncbi:hypothetical protein V6S66_14520 [Aeromicrobium sp. Sec7.5]
MPKHLLDHLHVSAGRDRKGRRCVSQLVRMKVRHADLGSSYLERSTKRGHAHCFTAADPPEDEVLGGLAVNVRPQVLYQEPRDRDGTTLMGLRGAPHHPVALHGRYRLRDHGAPRAQVEPHDPKRGHLAEPYARVREEQDHESVELHRLFLSRSVLADLGRQSARVREGIDLCMS